MEGKTKETLEKIEEEKRRREAEIKENIENTDEEKIKESHEKNTAKAEKLLNDEDKMEKFLQKLEKKLKTVPVAGNALSNVPLMISLVRSYMKKEYTEIPAASIISIVLTLIYIVSPIDFIPDILPGGYIDDGIIVAGCIAMIKTDLEDYRRWKKENGKDYNDIPDYNECSEEAERNSSILSAFFKGKKSSSK